MHFLRHVLLTILLRTLPEGCKNSNIRSELFVIACALSSMSDCSDQAGIDSRDDEDLVFA